MGDKYEIIRNKGGSTWRYEIRVNGNHLTSADTKITAKMFIKKEKRQRKKNKKIDAKGTGVIYTEY